jgi:hypothetical protein
MSGQGGFRRGRVESAAIVVDLYHKALPGID